ncbi:hypothetical protein GFK21_23290, partial [Salmonella enterica subsp. enterica serovar Enteritidis]|nr:hypothetical protein [Salmonella enterica subsp. enterica serovar Enteritidis]
IVSISSSYLISSSLFYQLARSAGTYVQIVARDGAYVTLRLRSGEMRKVEADCRATLGEVSNGRFQNFLDQYSRFLVG